MKTILVGMDVIQNKPINNMHFCVARTQRIQQFLLPVVVVANWLVECVYFVCVCFMLNSCGIIFVALRNTHGAHSLWCTFVNKNVLGF